MLHARVYLLSIITYKEKKHGLPKIYEYLKILSVCSQDM